MKKIGYYPALIFIMLICASIVGAFGFFSAQTLKRMSGYKGSDVAYKESVKQLNDEKTAMENNQQADRTYNEYFVRWKQKESALDEAKLKEKLQKMAEELGVSIYEVVPLNAPEKEDNGKIKTAEIKTPRRPKMPMRVNSPDGVLPGQGDSSAKSGAGMVELRIVILGPFAQLMAWMERAENELGGLRIVRTSWVARSTEEVKLTVGLRYKIVGDSQ